MSVSRFGSWSKFADWFVDLFGTGSVCAIILTGICTVVFAVGLSKAEAADMTAPPAYSTFQVQSDSLNCFTFVRFTATGQIFMLAQERCT
jgi:hypothetical protein